MSVNSETAYLIQKVVQESGRIELPAEGNSMYPLIRAGAVCRFVRCDPSLLKKGDIVLFFSPSRKLIAHRFYDSHDVHHQLLYSFKGDSNLDFDDPISREQIIGKLSFFHKNGLLIRSEFLPYQIWGSLIMRFPVISRALRKYLNWRAGR